MILFATNQKKKPSMRRLTLFAVFVFAYMFSIITLASQIRAFETSENIQQTAKIFLEELTVAADNPAIEVKVNNIDPRLKLRQCDIKLKAYLPPGSKHRGKTTVAVRCDVPVAWKVFVSASIHEFAEVIVANRSLSRKSVIAEQDIVKKRVNISSLRKQPIMTKSQVLGSTPKRYIRAGSIIFEDSICMVCRGDSVNISAKSEFFSLNLKGLALADAAIGETTLVRNTQSKRSFSAKVIGRNQLEVSLSTTN